MQKTFLYKSSTKIVERLAIWAANPWRRYSLLAIIFFIGFLDFRKTNLALINISKNINAINAPIGSIKANTPLIIPREPPIKNPIKKIITSNEYLLHGFTAQVANLSRTFVDDLYKNVFCIL